MDGRLVDMAEEECSPDVEASKDDETSEDTHDVHEKEKNEDWSFVILWFHR